MATPCKAHRTDGQPCSNFAMLGGTVCHAHGGRAPRVRAAAERRLAAEKLRKQIAAREARARRRVDKERAQRVVRAVAQQAWLEELGPHYVWDWHSPKTLRRIALEMRRCANELTMLAATGSGIHAQAAD
jgi:hypothetical protein